MRRALDHGDVDDARRLAHAAAKPADAARGDVEETLQTRRPLLHQLTAMHQDQRIGFARGDDRGGHHRLAEAGGGGKHPAFVLQQRC